jgi:hypothetical protein
MDTRIVSIFNSHFTDVQTFSSETGTQYVTGTYRNKKYMASVQRSYILTVDNKYICAGATVDNILDALQCILSDKLYHISDVTKLVASVTGTPLAY